MALPNADALMLAAPAVNPATVTVATPELLVIAVGAFKLRIAGSVAAKDTVTPGITAPNTSLTVALSDVVAPPTISDDAPALVRATLAPITFIWVVAGLAVHPVHDAVRVEIRFV